MKNNNIKTFVAVGIGAALFFVLGRFVAIPSPVPNTNISLQYAVLGLLAAMYGPVAGGLIGFIGHALIDLSWGGIPWWSWVIASAFTGVVVGLFAKKLNLQEGDFNKGKVITYTISNVIAHLIAWIVVAPVLDILIYAEPVKKVFAHDCKRFAPDVEALFFEGVGKKTGEGRENLFSRKVLSPPGPHPSHSQDFRLVGRLLGRSSCRMGTG